MKINVSDNVIVHFWEEPEEGSQEFWAFLWPVRAKVGDPIYFYNNKKLIASSVIDRIEKPGMSSCDKSGNYKNRWKVYWRQEDFKDERRK
jgi:hypothetical protein